jgi:ribose transport system substrate-binding protein
MFVALCTVTAIVATTAACRDGKSDGPPAAAGPSASASGSAPPVDILTESKNLVDTIHKGTYRAPDPTTRIAAKGKKVAIISRGQQSPSSQIPTDAADEAAKALGWETVRFDLKLDPRNAPQAVRDAIAAGVDGIVTNTDCAYAPAEFAEAKAKEIEIVPLFTFDCTDPTIAGRTGQSLFTVGLNYRFGSGEKVDAVRYNAAGGTIAASALIAATNGTAKVIAVTDVTSTILTYTHAGFMTQMKRCTTCQVLEEIKYTGADVLDGGLLTKIKDALQRHPEVTALRGGNSTAVQVGIAPALVATRMQNQVLVIGGEGQERDLDLIRTKQGLNMTLSTDSQWIGWAVIDALNSAFNGEESRTPGVGAMLIDREHNLPPSGPVQHNVNYKSVFRKAWGVGG